MDLSLAAKIKTLQLYLDCLPDSLPFPSAEGATYQFQNFTLNEDWVKDVGEEGAVNRELEVRLGSRAKGPIILKERGPGISALANVFEQYLSKYPASVILEKWLSDMIISAQSAYESAKVQVSCVAY